MNKQNHGRSDVPESEFSRRHFLKLIGQGALAHAALPASLALAADAARGGVTTAATRRAPNVIFILADDLGYGDLSCYGQQKFQTPHLDRLASEGVRFTQCYSGSTVCAPSRACLMTGLHTGHARIRGNGNTTFLAEERIVSEMFKDAGYATGLFGKWGMGNFESTGAPLRKGFDEFFGFLTHTQAHYQYPETLFRNSGERVRFPDNAAKKTHYANDLFTQESLNFVRRHRDKPFFLNLNYCVPHASLEAPEDSLQRQRGRFPETSFGSPTSHYAMQPTPRAAFVAMITRMDEQVGQLLALLRELKLEEDTLIFFSSDNGPHREGGADPAFFNSGGPLRGIKRDLYEGGIRVPMIARWPGHIPAATVSEQVWYFPDFLPTMAELISRPAPQNLDGISMLPSLLGRPQQNHPYLYWEFHERGFQQAVRMDNWKALRSGLDQPLQLYDLKADIGEKNDAAAQHPQVVKRIEEIMRTARTDSPRYPATGKRGASQDA